jgi:YVTN family beta-propeller protein
MYNITGLASSFSSDMMISADSRSLWVPHKLAGKLSVVDLAARKVIHVLDTGTETNHPNFAVIDGVNHAFVTVAAENVTKVYRQAEPQDIPVLVKVIQSGGIQPHPIWPSPDNTRMYVANQHSDTVDVIDTATLEVIASMKGGQDTQSLIYVSRAVPEGSDGMQNLGTQGLGYRVENQLLPVAQNTSNSPADGTPNPYGESPQALITIRETDNLDMFQVIGRFLIVNATYTASAVCHTCTEQERVPIVSFQASALTDEMKGCGGNEQVLAFLKFFEAYKVNSVRVEQTADAKRGMK